MNDLHVGFGAGEGPQVQRFFVGRRKGNPLASAGKHQIPGRKHFHFAATPNSSTSCGGGNSPGVSGTTAIVKPNPSATARDMASTDPIAAATRCVRHVSGKAIPSTLRGSPSGGGRLHRTRAARHSPF